MAEAGRPEDQCDEAVEDEFGEIIKCRSGRNDFQYLVYNKHQASCQCQHLTEAIDTNLTKCSMLFPNGPRVYDNLFRE